MPTLLTLDRKIGTEEQLENISSFSSQEAIRGQQRYTEKVS